jgi:hypothetical protein
MRSCTVHPVNAILALIIEDMIMTTITVRFAIHKGESNLVALLQKFIHPLLEIVWIFLHHRLNSYTIFF